MGMILSSPLDIFNAAKTFFPKVQGALVLDEQENIRDLSLRLQEDCPEVHFRVAVLREDFFEDLQTFFRTKKLNEGAAVRVDPARYSVEGKQLSNWKPFRRMMFLSSGRKISSAIIEFLRDGSNDLASLGLSPEHVEAQNDEEALNYFREFYYALEKTPDNERIFIFRKFQQVYPRTFMHFVAEDHRKKIDTYKRTQVADPYHRIVRQLNAMVLAQEVAAEALATFLASSDEGNKIFMFVGPSGVGKTEMANSVSKVLSNKRMLTIYMNTHTTDNSITRLFGVPPGYVGGSSVPIFAQNLQTICNAVEVSKTETGSHYIVRDSVVLFDELEKAHPDVRDPLLSLFQDKKMDLVYTKRRNLQENTVTLHYEFERCIFIATSNLFDEQIRAALSQNIPGETRKKRAARLDEHFRILNRTIPDPRAFSEPFLGRIKVITFGPIPKGPAYIAILRKQFRTLCAQIKSEYRFKQVLIENEEAFLFAIQEAIYGDGTDIRKITREVFPIVQQIVLNNKREWGDPSEVELLFTTRENVPIIRVFHVLTKYGHKLEIATLNMF